MGGMSAFIPVKGDDAKNRAVNEKVRKDKAAEAMAGHDGSWIAHPGLLQAAQGPYDQYMPQANQIYKQRDDEVTARELLDIGEKGTITMEGLRTNISVGLAYMEAWLRGVGCIPVHNLMEDAATAEISRTQIWQWIQHGACITATGEKITKAMVSEMLQEECRSLVAKHGQTAYDASKFGIAAPLLLKMLTKDTLDEFLTTNCYPWITRYMSRY